MDPESELENLLDARRKIDKRIRELKNDKYRKYGTIIITLGENARNRLWKKVYRVKFLKTSSMIESENESLRTIIEDTDLDKICVYMRQIRKDLDTAIEDTEKRLKKNEDPNK